MVAGMACSVSVLLRAIPKMKAPARPVPGRALGLFITFDAREFRSSIRWGSREDSGSLFGLICAQPIQREAPRDRRRI
jgi:hypothetical protein